MMTESDINESCAAYLKNLEGIERIARGLRNKYESLNDVAGNYVLKNPSEAEKRFLRGLFRKDYSDVKQISISLKKFERAFDGTKYEGISLVEVLSAYFREEIVSKKDMKHRASRMKEAFWRDVLKKAENPRFHAWLTETAWNSKSKGGNWLNKQYESDPEKLVLLIHRLDKIASLLAGGTDFWARPVLAAKATKDPHALDDDEALFKFMLLYLSAVSGSSIPENAYERSVLLEQFGIIADGSQLSVDTYGLEGFDEHAVSLGWDVFFQRHEPLILTRANLREAASIQASSAGPVFAFENPSVFHTFIQMLPSCSAVCTSGQVNQTALALLGILEKCNVPVLYNGDYDPEGLMIAQRLCNRFGNVSPWYYNCEAYEKCMSDKKISERRLIQLRELSHPALIMVAEKLEKYKKAGYQEYIVEELIGARKSDPMVRS